MRAKRKGVSSAYIHVYIHTYSGHLVCTHVLYLQARCPSWTVPNASGGVCGVATASDSEAFICNFLQVADALQVGPFQVLQSRGIFGGARSVPLLIAAVVSGATWLSKIGAAYKGLSQSY